MFLKRFIHISRYKQLVHTKYQQRGTRFITQASHKNYKSTFGLFIFLLYDEFPEVTTGK